MGSDHLPIRIELSTNCTRKRDAPFIRWDTFRETIKTAPPSLPLVDQIQLAVKAATKTYKVKEDAPNPDMHLLNLGQADSKLNSDIERQSTTSATKFN